jgi:hypothetical protein
MTFRRACVLSLLFASAVPAPAFADVIREGVGERRESLRRMELAPFPAEAWSKLSDWTNGPAPTSADFSGKPVLICTWASWHNLGARAVKVALRASEKYGKDGLIVVLAHDPEGWKEADKPKPPAEGLTVLVANDAKGEFRKAIRSDNNPDFYVIDRAGQLRYADIATESVEEAVETVVKEKTDDAAGTKARLQKERDEAARKAGLTGGIRNEIDLTAIPELPYVAPAPEKYEHAGFPRAPRDPNQSNQNEDVPRAFPMPESGFYPSKPEMKGRVIVVYFWHPSILASYEPYMSDMELVQRQKGRDVCVVGVVAQLVKDQSGRPASEDEVDPVKALARLERIAKGRKINHAVLQDVDASMLGVFSQNNQSFVTGPPSHGLGVIISSDGNIRWWGRLDDTDNFPGMLDRIISADPGVKVRRENEANYIKNKK